MRGIIKDRIVVLLRINWAVVTTCVILYVRLVIQAVTGCLFDTLGIMPDSC